MTRRWGALAGAVLLFFSLMTGSAAGSTLTDLPRLPNLDMNDLLLATPPIQTATRLATDRISAAVDASGDVWVWGMLPGQEGAVAPHKLTGLPPIAQIAIGDTWLVAQAQDGTVWFWGETGWDLLGEGSSATHLTPVRVQGLSGVKAVAADYNTFYALRSDGTVWHAGSSPGTVTGLSGITQIASGVGFRLALDSAGRVWSWVDIHYGQLGSADRDTTVTLGMVLGLTDVVSIGTGSFQGLAVRADGTVWGWGYNGDRQLGGEAQEIVQSPRPIPGLTGVAKVTGGTLFTVALRKDGTVWTLGRGSYGSLGTGVPDSSAEPVQVPGVTGVLDVAAGGGTAMALLGNGTVMAWGSSGFGQMGGLLGEASTPMPILEGWPLSASDEIQSQSHPRVRLVTPATVPDQNATFSVPVVIENGGSLSGLGFALEFNLSVLELVDAQPGDFFQVVSPDTFGGARLHFAAAGRADADATNGTLVTLTFRRMAQPEVEIEVYPYLPLGAINDSLEPVLFTIQTATLPGVQARGTGSVSGTLLLEGRDSAAGSRVTVVGRPDLTTVTDSQGRFLLSGLSVGTTQLIARHPGYLSQRLEAQVQEGKTAVTRAATMKAGDIDGDERIHVSDLTLFAGAIGKQAGDPGYHALADLDGDGQVGEVDQRILLGNFGDYSNVPPAAPSAPGEPATAPSGAGGLLDVKVGGAAATLSVDAPAKAPLWDPFVVAATVTNTGSSDREFSLYLDLPDDISILDGVKSMRTTGVIPAGGSATVEWSLSTVVSGTKEIRISATADGADPITQKVQVVVGP